MFENRQPLEVLALGKGDRGRVVGRGFQAPSDTLNLATVGVSGMGSSNTGNVMSQNIVALCDVDDVLMERTLTRWKERHAIRSATRRSI